MVFIVMIVIFFKTGLPVSMQKLMYKGNDIQELVYLFPKVCQCHLYQSVW